MTDQELLQAIRAITKEEIQASETRVMAATRAEIQESETRIMKNVVTLMDAEFGPKFNLLAENQDILKEKIDNLERKFDSLEDKVLEQEFRLKRIK